LKESERNRPRNCGGDITIERESDESVRIIERNLIPMETEFVATLKTVVIRYELNTVLLYSETGISYF
jgi:hypothetical protein